MIFCPGLKQSDPAVEEKVKKAAKDFPAIKILPSVSHDRMLALIAAADFLVANSREESMSTVAAEAWMLETPTILSCGGGAKGL